MAKRIDSRNVHQKKGVEWFFNEIRKASKDINYNAFNPVSDPFIGSLFAFIYSAKYADKLPYWDKLPLVIPFNILDDGFIGLNLHYASGDDRTRLLQYLLRIKTKKSKREYANISYQALQTSIKTSIFEPCIHRYLKTHIKSRLVKINLEEWENIAKLPLAQWQRGKK